MKYIRTCQECGFEQECPRPTHTDKTKDGLTDAFCNRKCKKCKSEALDLGSDRPSTQAEIDAALKFDESFYE